LQDEATAQVDQDTDLHMQRLIRSSFPGCTLLIIAHRLDTILDCDKVMVMENARLVEFDSPARLMAAAGSAFSELVRDSESRQPDVRNTTVKS